MSADKSALRKELLEKRMEFDDKTVEDKSRHIISRLKSAVNWSDITSVHIYLPIKRRREIDTWELADWLWNKYPKVQVSTSIYGQSRSLRHVIITPATRFKNDALGIPIPVSGYKLAAKKYDLIVVPMLGFDKKLHRIGYGQGVYDKFLSQQAESVKMGLAYEVSKIKNIPSEDHDVALDMIVTENGVYKKS